MFSPWRQFFRVFSPHGGDLCRSDVPCGSRPAASLHPWHWVPLGRPGVFSLSCILLFAASLLVISPPVHAAETPSTDGAGQRSGVFSDAQREEVTAIVRDHILRHPELIQEAVVALVKKKMAAKIAHQNQLIQEREDEIFGAKSDFVNGNPEGDVSVVVFFDYNCPHCRSAVPILEKVVSSSPNVRIVFKELPVISPESHQISSLALAALHQNQYLAYHRTLMSRTGNLDRDAALEIAAEIGLDVEKLTRDAEHSDIQQNLSENRRLAADLGIEGTPFYIVKGPAAHFILQGAATFEDLNKRIVAARTPEAKDLPEEVTN